MNKIIELLQEKEIDGVRYNNIFYHVTSVNGDLVTLNQTDSLEESEITIDELLKDDTLKVYQWTEIK